jgi:hypothetical protein
MYYTCICLPALTPVAIPVRERYFCLILWVAAENFSADEEAALMDSCNLATSGRDRLSTEAYLNGAWSHLFCGRKVRLNRLDVLGEMSCRDFISATRD